MDNVIFLKEDGKIQFISFFHERIYQGLFKKHVAERNPIMLVSYEDGSKIRHRFATETDYKSAQNVVQEDFNLVRMK